MLFRRLALAVVILAWGATAAAQTATGRVTGRVLDVGQGLPMPGATVEVVGIPVLVYTDVEGRFTIPAPAGAQQLKVTFPGFGDRLVTVEVAANGLREVDVVIAPAAYEETVDVQGQRTDAETSSLSAQLLERRRANSITDNLGAQEMRANADSSAAAALQRVTGLSVVDDQYIFVRGLGERYSNTTLNGATLPSTEPERKVVSLDMFPAGLLDSVSVVKSYTPDRSAEFAGGLVEIVPSKLPIRPLLNFSYNVGGNSARLASLTITEVEFRKNVWPHLPASAPEVGMPFEYLWAETSAKSRGYLAEVLHEFGGRQLTVEAVAFGGPATDYGAFRIHPKTRVTVRDAAGSVTTERLFGSLLEADGAWKIFSFVVD